ncbi:MAG: DUF4031 domain-containing protein [Patescibacteria group bacterium]|nr:DUF4031 domain-containing protein [Patescibacteria group bacterium]
MSVYVDDGEYRFGRMKMCHMLADTHAELLQMADEIGVARRWIQHLGTYREHFDICLSKRRLAIKAGATPVSWRAVGALLCRRRADAEARLHG